MQYYLDMLKEKDEEIEPGTLPAEKYEHAKNAIRELGQHLSDLGRGEEVE